MTVQQATSGNPSEQSDLLLKVEDLLTVFRTHHGVVRAVDHVSLDIRRGEALGIVGESGSGKSMFCLSLMGLVPKPAGHIEGGRVLFKGTDLLQLSPSKMREIRGRQISMILQDPLMSLNPVYSTGNQVDETIRRTAPHATWTERWKRAVALLELVRIPEATERLKSYPHHLSGGMRQRVCAAIGLAAKPDLLLADEPTTALDVTTQAEFLRVLRELRAETGVSIILVTHDLGIVAQNCDRVAVMYAGRIVEEAPVRTIYRHPQHPYTAALLKSVPELDPGALGQRLTPIEGNPPDLAALGPGCRFAPRCPLADERCHAEYPPELQVDDDHRTACWKPDEVSTLGIGSAS